MSREIKFRWWDRNHKRIIQSDCLLINANGKTITEWVKIGDYDYLLVAGENADLMQFTGLKDKNGNEIYEGDIVKFTKRIYIDMKYDSGFKRGTVAKVSYLFSGHSFTIGGGMYYDLDNLLQKTLIKRKSVCLKHCVDPELCDCKIIGNVLENPELLEAR